jgi:hypothetical protein
MRPAILIGLLGLLLPVAAAAKQELPIGSKYVPMRNAMLAAGYRSYREAPRGASDMFVNQQQVEPGIRSAFPELVRCNGTGANYCTFIFKRGKSDLVAIMTTGEIPAQLRIVSIQAFSPQAAEDEYKDAYAADE